MIIILLSVYPQSYQSLGRLNKLKKLASPKKVVAISTETDSEIDMMSLSDESYDEVLIDNGYDDIEDEEMPLYKLEPSEKADSSDSDSDIEEPDE